MKQILQYKQHLIIAAICVLTFCCFRYTAQNQFTCWDDDYYVTNDPFIKGLNFDNLKVIFTKDITKNNYHPLCMLSLAFNYSFAGLNPSSYYVTNIVIHVLNVWLVFLVVLALCTRLSIRDPLKLFLASLTALWFGAHPMRVESVSWIAERKDVLYAFFYFLGILSWLRYTGTGTRKWYWVTLVLFIASCLSKPMAVVFPLSLILIDFLLAREWTLTVLTDKIPFFLVALIAGGGAYYTQSATGAIADFGKLTLAERIMYASYGFDMYISKFFNPTYLSTFYPYPYRYIDGTLPTIYYAAPVIAIAIFIVPTLLAWKLWPKPTAQLTTVPKALPFAPQQYSVPMRIVIFGIGYLFANLVFVLQFISCGAAIMADRYSYVAYLGFIFMVVFLISELMRILPGLRVAFYGIIIMVSGWFAWLCYERTYAWHDSETLLSDAIEKYPMRALLSYKWLGNYYLDKGELDKAMENYGVLTMLHAADDKVYDNVGNIQMRKNDYKAALASFNSSLAIKNNAYKTYLDRALALSRLGDTAGANQDLAMAYRLSPTMAAGVALAVSGAPAAIRPSGNSNLDSCILQLRSGDTLRAFRNYILAIKADPAAERTLAEIGFNYVNTTHQFQPALALYNMLLKLNTGEPHYYFYRGVAYYSLGNTAAAKTDWLIAVKMKSNEVKQSASNNLSVIFDNEGDYDRALYYAELSKSLGFHVEDAFIEKLRNKKAGKK